MLTFSVKRVVPNTVRDEVKGVGKKRGEDARFDVDVDFGIDVEKSLGGKDLHQKRNHEPR